MNQRLLKMAVLVAAVVLLVGLAQTAAGHSALKGLGVTAPAQGYTELSFAAVTGLPASLPHRRSSLEVPFTLHNVEGTSRTYRWQIDARFGDKSTSLAQGETKAASGEQVTLEPRVRVACPRRRVRVEVRLRDPAQAIGFWVRCASGKGDSPP